MEQQDKAALALLAVTVGHMVQARVDVLETMVMKSDNPAARGQ
jgi:hypothetical protein